MTMKIYSLLRLKEILFEKKRAGKKIVFTNGCFDLLHVGHVRYLTEACSFGDILVVGINSDASVRRLKPDRPIIPQEQRAEMLSFLKMVHYVVIFDEDTPYETIRTLSPDVLVKGGDWKKEDIVGADLVAQVHSLSYIPGISTTAIIQRILEHCGNSSSS